MKLSSFHAIVLAVIGLALFFTSVWIHGDWMTGGAGEEGGGMIPGLAGGSPVGGEEEAADDIAEETAVAAPEDGGTVDHVSTK